MIGIINYGAGNMFSLQAALDRIAVEYEVIDRADADISNYDRFIVPGVGHASPAMQKLRDAGLDLMIKRLERPVLGICLGMQLLTRFSEEGDTDLLNIVPLNTLHFKGRITEKIPHMGWNKVHHQKKSPLFEDIDKDAYFYFVHSYFINFDDEFTAAHTNYGLKFSAALEKDNFYGVQFHPEKSGAEGERLLLNFTKLA